MFICVKVKIFVLFANVVVTHNIVFSLHDIIPLISVSLLYAFDNRITTGYCSYIVLIIDVPLISYFKNISLLHIRENNNTGRQVNVIE